MSTIGTIVDMLGEVPEAIGLVKRLVERIRSARPEDRDAIIAAMETAADHTHDAAVRAIERLRQARRDDPTVEVRTDSSETTEPRQE